MISHQRARRFVEWVDRVSDEPVLRIAVTERALTGEILGIAIDCEHRGFGMGCQVRSPFSEGLVSWSDIDGQPYWTAWDDQSSSQGSLRTRWISRDELVDGATEPVDFPAEVDPVAAMGRGGA